jgi:CDP-diacylglycerol--glycerol-3-phosphate 3-phosphatidyltransferase/cardiolipin synthase
MIHAKTAVADGRWARIGSTNLNISSWLANREIDVAIEDESVAGELAARFCRIWNNPPKWCSAVTSAHRC